MQIESGAQNNTIGGTTAAEQGVIIDNTVAGIRITDSGTDNNQVLGGYVGVASDGVTAVPNGTGIEIQSGA